MAKAKPKTKIIVQCGNCDWKGNEDDFIDVHNSCEQPKNKGLHLFSCRDLGERLEPGSEVPFGDCPKCQCFCYIVKPRV